MRVRNNKRFPAFSYGAGSYAQLAAMLSEGTVGPSEARPVKEQPTSPAPVPQFSPGDLVQMSPKCRLPMHERDAALRGRQLEVVVGPIEGPAGLCVVVAVDGKQALLAEARLEAAS